MWEFEPSTINEGYKVHLDVDMFCGSITRKSSGTAKPPVKSVFLDVKVHKNLSVLLTSSLLTLIKKKLPCWSWKHPIQSPFHPAKRDQKLTILCYVFVTKTGCVSNYRTGKQGKITATVCPTCEELTILLLSLHQSIHRTLLPCPFRVLRVFMTNWPRPSTFSATWCTAQTHRKENKTSFVKKHLWFICHVLH